MPDDRKSCITQAAAHFRRCVEACEQALARAQLYEVLYHRAFALLALECVNVPPASPPGNPGETSVVQEAYRKAIEVNGAAGVLKQTIHEVERLQRILELRSLPVPDVVGEVLSLLRQAG